MIEFAKLLTTSLGQSVRTILAKVAMFGTDGDDESAEQMDSCEVLHPVGFVSRPSIASTTEAVVVRDGDEVHVLMFVDKTSTLHTVEEGAAELYSPKEPTCVVKLRASGKIEITAKSGEDVVFNGGTKAVGRVDDSVNGGTVTAVAGATAVTFTYTPAGGSPGAPSTTLLLTGGKITSGAPNVKA